MLAHRSVARISCEQFLSALTLAGTFRMQPLMPAAELILKQTVQELYCDHHGWLFGWLRKKLGCPQNAADLAHDTFTRILASRDALGAIREPRAYLSTTAQRLIIDGARRKRIEDAYLRELA